MKFQIYCELFTEVNQNQTGDRLSPPATYSSHDNIIKPLLTFMIQWNIGTHELSAVPLSYQATNVSSKPPELSMNYHAYQYILFNHFILKHKLVRFISADSIPSNISSSFCINVPYFLKQKLAISTILTPCLFWNTSL